MLNFNKNHDDEKVFNFFFPNVKSKVCSKDFSTNELEVDLTSSI